MLRRFGVSLPGSLLEQFDDLLRRRGYENRSEAVRDLIRESLVEEQWACADKEVVGAISLVYDHETMGLAQKLTEIQHQSHDLVVAAMHIHMDEHNCLETLVVRGTPAQIEQVANLLISARGVKHGRLFRTTVGEEL